MSDRNVNTNAEINRLNNLYSKTSITLSEVSNDKNLTTIFKACDVDKPVDILNTNKELTKWKESIETYKKEVISHEYTVQSGDTIPNIIKTLGYTGIDQIKYEKALTAKLKRENKLSGKNNLLTIGDTIELLTDEELKQCGIKKVSSNSTSASTETKEPLTQGVNDNSGLNNNIKTPKNNPSQAIIQNSVEKIQQNLTAQGHKTSIIKFEYLSKSSKANLKPIIDAYKKIYNIEPTIIFDETKGEFHLFFNTANTKNGKNMGEQSIEIIPSHTQVIKNRYFKNGKIVQDVETINGNTTNSRLIQKPNKAPKTKKYIKEALPIGIKVSTSILQGATTEQRKEFHTFIQTLANQKARLMKDLNIDNDTYNRFVKLAIGIAIQESG